MLIVNGKNPEKFLVQVWEPEKTGIRSEKEVGQIFLTATANTNNRNSDLSVCLVDLVLMEGLEADSCSQCMDGQCKESGQLPSASLGHEEPPPVSSPCPLFE